MAKPKTKHATKQASKQKPPKSKLRGIHPNSRKAMKLTGMSMRQDRLEKRKTTKKQKQQQTAEKLQWFRDNLPQNEDNQLTNSQVLNLIDCYFQRYDSELEQISIINGIKKRTPTQHVSRRDHLVHQIEKEKSDFDTCGFDIPDLLSSENVSYLRDWANEHNLMHNIKSRRFTRKMLEVNLA